MQDFHHGVRVIQQSAGSYPIRTIQTAVVGIVGTAPDADATEFPINQPVLLASSSRSVFAGLTQGALDASAVTAGGSGYSAATVTISGGGGSGATATAVIVDGAIDSITIDNPGSGYTSLPTITIGGDGTGATASATLKAPGTLPKSMDAIFDQVSPYVIVIRVAEGADDAETTSNVIAGVQALLTAQAVVGLTPRILGVPGLDVAAVAAELAGVADQLRAFCYVSADGATTKEEAVAYRDTLGSRRMMVIWPDFLGWDTAANATGTMWAVARALGLRAKIDNDVGWHKTLSNVTVNGVTGIETPVQWGLQDEQSEANYLNENEVTTLIQRDGFRFWGSRTCSADPHYAFESAVRTDDVLADTIAEAHFWAVDKPMSKGLINDILESVNAKFRHLKALGYIVDGRAWLDSAKNTKETLMAGQLYIDYDFSPVPPLENLIFTQTITNEYLLELVQQ